MEGVADLHPKTIENARRQFVELYGSALVLNTYLKIALLLVSLIAVGLLLLNFRTQAKYASVKPIPAMPRKYEPTVTNTGTATGSSSRLLHAR